MKTIGLVDWAIILWVSIDRGLLAGVVMPKPMVPTMVPFFSAVFQNTYKIIFMLLKLFLLSEFSILFIFLCFSKNIFN